MDIEWWRLVRSLVTVGVTTAPLVYLYSNATESLLLHNTARGGVSCCTPSDCGAHCQLTHCSQCSVTVLPASAQPVTLPHSTLPQCGASLLSAFIHCCCRSTSTLLLFPFFLQLADRSVRSALVILSFRYIHRQPICRYTRPNVLSCLPL